MPIVLGGRRAALHPLHPRRGRPAARPMQQGIDAIGLALHHGFDAAVGEVAHPAGHAKARSLLQQGIAVADALHAPTNAQLNCLQLQNFSAPAVPHRECAGTPW